MVMGCVDMFGIEEGLPSDYEVGEDAFEFVNELMDNADVIYTEQLSQPLHVGSHIVCTGTPTVEHPWFSLNIGSGSLEAGKADIAVHFNPRMPQQYVVRNTRQHGSWQKEETTSHRAFPFKVGRPFKLEILIADPWVLFAVDGEHYCGYAHRVPSAFISSWVQLIGLPDAALTVTNSDIYPALAPPRPEVPYYSDENVSPENELTWEAHPVAILPQGIPQGHQFVIQGRLRRILHSFKLDLCAEGGHHEWPWVPMPLHMDMRAHEHQNKSRQLVILNTWQDVWGEERRQRSANIVPGEMFLLRIVHTPDQWQVYADDTMIGSMEHRIPPDEVRSMRLRGDLIPSRIYIQPTFL